MSTREFFKTVLSVSVFATVCAVIGVAAVAISDADRRERDQREGEFRAACRRSGGQFSVNNRNLWVCLGGEQSG